MAGWVNDYLAVPYRDGGRDCAGFDCWGLVRHVLHSHYGLPWLESFGHVSPDDKQHLTDSYQQVVPAFVPGACVPGAVACGFRGACLIHVGVVVNSGGQPMVLHTSRRHGPTLQSPRAFRRLFERTAFFEYSHAKRFH